MRALTIIGGALAGGVIGYWVGAYVMCTWIWPESNLCGLPAVFIAGPIGLVVGGVIAAWQTARPSK
jgi:hypothetical protein